VATLHGGRMRFAELEQRIPGISQPMLTLLSEFRDKRPLAC